MRGQFGIIVCRKIVNWRKAKARQKNLKDDDKFVIVLTDKDIKKLAKFKKNEQEEKIDDFMEIKFKKLI